MTPKWQYAQAFRAGDFSGMLEAAKRKHAERRRQMIWRGLGLLVCVATVVASGWFVLWLIMT